MHTPVDRERIADEAVDWFLKLRNVCASQQDQQAFSEWLTRSPAHVEEYMAVASVWIGLYVPDEGHFATRSLIAAARDSREADNIVRLPERPGKQPASVASLRPRITRPTFWGSLVAMAAALMVMTLPWVGSIHTSGEAFETVVGEQRSGTLRDGSVLFLNTNSKVQVQWLPSERHIDLIRGEARFQVTHDSARPFVVVTSKATVRALGTVFNVRADMQSTQVAVMEGQVEVNSDARPTQDGQTSVRLAAGQRAAVTNRGIELNRGPSIESVTAWTERRLVFHNESLSTVVGEFNRYRTDPLVLDDPRLAAIRISGVFDLNDPESLLAYLESFETVRVERSSDGSEHLARGPAQ